ncbi:MAG TPA: pyrroline-5-carboxylate reductase [Kiloniellales bacterium]|nr:pyrroline-5-carboxylate reductase [Kiloniellales bacterium]
MADPRIALDGPLLLVGCGKMGGALLGGWLARGVSADQVTVIEPQAEALARIGVENVRRIENTAALPAGYAPAVVVLAVKPQQMDAVLPPLASLAGPGTVFLSIAAGRTIASYEKALGEAAAIVRAMPNTPAAVGRGMTVLCANPPVGSGQRALCEALLAAVGETAWIDDEALLDPVTAISGGGPAYVFLLIECLAEAGIEAGLPRELAMRLARTTVAGAGELVRQSAEPAATLRENVTSPGGTTQEALAVLMGEDGLQPLMTRAIAAATRRSRELAQ